jgi:hypothetical protein
MDARENPPISASVGSAVDERTVPVGSGNISSIFPPGPPICNVKRSDSPSLTRASPYMIGEDD